VYDPIDLSKKTENIVVTHTLKKYYRFRPTGFYGGIATADTVGCNLRCRFCWSGHSVWSAKETGEFYSPEQVVEKLQTIAEKKGYQQLRISGGEPTIGKYHLLHLLERLSTTYEFILETNGILLGYDPTFVEALSVFPQIHVRVCLKGADAEEFSLLTGAKQGFEYQLKALKLLHKAHIRFHIALVCIHPEKKPRLFKKLREMNLESVMIEEEEITLYPLVRKRLQEEQLLHYFEKP